MWEWLANTTNKSKQLSRVGTEWAVGSVEKKAPPPYNGRAVVLFLIAGESERERQKRQRLRVYSACSSWTLSSPPVNTGINLGPAAKAQPKKPSPLLLYSQTKTLQGDIGIATSMFPPPSCTMWSHFPHTPLLFFTLLYLFPLFFYSKLSLYSFWLIDSLEFLKGRRTAKARCRVPTSTSRLLAGTQWGH